MADLPLEGLKVLDFCWVAVGPMTTKYLSEYGAPSPVANRESTGRVISLTTTPTNMACP